jgi:TonB family protein
MRLTIILFLLAFPILGLTHNGLFPSCPAPHIDEHESPQNIKKPKAVSKSSMNYPPQMLRAGLEGRVILGFTVSKKGNIENIETLATTNKGFVKASITALKRFKYEPAIDLDTKLPINKKVLHAFTFELENTEKNLFFISDDLTRSFEKSFYSYAQKPPKNAIKLINKKLEKKINNLQRAMYLTLRAEKTSENWKKREDLEAALEIVNSLNQLDPNVNSVFTFIVRGMSLVFNKDKKEINRVTSLLRRVLKESVTTHYPLREQYENYLDFAIASYNAESFCESHEAFKKTIEVTEKLGMKKNPNLFNYRDLAKAQALKRLKAQ